MEFDIHSEGFANTFTVNILALALNIVDVFNTVHILLMLILKSYSGSVC